MHEVPISAVGRHQMRRTAPRPESLPRMPPMEQIHSTHRKTMTRLPGLPSFHLHSMRLAEPLEA